MSDSKQDLDWICSCFLLGELSEDESAAFQIRIENEPAVADALAGAIELHAVCEFGVELNRELKVAGTGSDLVETNHPGPGVVGGRNRLLAVLSLTAALLLAVSAGLYWTGEQSRRAHDEEMLASIWAIGISGENESDDSGLVLTEQEIESVVADDGQQGWVFAAAMELEPDDFDDGEEWVF